jgi:N-acetyl-anhydromuramyl-L-alanine amidase AmpD
MSQMPNIPFTANQAILTPRRVALYPTAVVAHRTIGRWAGDYAVLSKDRTPSCHFLVGHQNPQWVQFVDTNVRANHAAGANDWAVGIEVSGNNDELMTEWQKARCAEILNWLGFPLDYYDDANNRRSSWVGVISHASIATTPEYKHYDHWLAEDWADIKQRLQVVVPTKEEEEMGFLGKIHNTDNTVWWFHNGARTGIPGPASSYNEAVKFLERQGDIDDTSVITVPKSYARLQEVVPLSTVR